MLCYVGKATKIFIFIISVIAITGLVLGFGIFRHKVHHKCTGEYCSFSDYSPPPPLQVPVTSLPDPDASNPSDSTVNSNVSPPPPMLPETSLPPPPPPETSLPPPPLPPPASVVTPPADVTAAPPLAFSPPSPVQVSPGPMNSS